MASFNWTQLIPAVGPENAHIATACVAGGVLVASGFAARVALGNGETAHMPSKSFGIRGVFEGITEFVTAISDMVLGKENRGFVPMFSALFTFIFVNNIFGLLPGWTPATDNINTTIAMGVFMFVVYNYLGFKEHGLGYLKHFMGPMLALAPLIFVVEIISHVVRPFSLGLRLYVNMLADHTLLGVALSMLPYFVPVILMFLGLFVSFMQAFVFMMLGMIYISMAVSHDH